jgi:hypothetical protein
VTREQATEDASPKENVLTGLTSVRAFVSSHHPETAPETTLETVSSDISASEKKVPTISTPRQKTPAFRPHLPRFARAKASHRPRIALQDRDLELHRTVSNYRLISTPQLLRLFEDESRDGIYRRLQGLFHHGYLDRIGTNPNASLVYGLGRRGAEILEVPHRKDVADPYVAHQLMIGDFRVAMTRAMTTRNIVLSWRTVPADSPVKPDGFFSLQFPDRPDGKNRAFLFLEADRSTMTRERFVQKLENYWRWYRTGGHTEKLGIKGFRVLTMTKSEERVRSLVLATRGSSELSSALRMFWFASELRIAVTEPARVLEPIWTTAAELDGLRGLLPAG